MNNTKGNPQQKRLFWSKKCEDFLIRIFWIGQDPPPLLTESKKKQFCYTFCLKNVILSLLIIGSNIDILRLLWSLTANNMYIQPYSWSPQVLNVYNIKPKLCAKHVLKIRE